jgi:8-oxo-dGTP pyrophosphatase MutT (NUDIX family)
MYKVFINEKVIYFTNNVEIVKELSDVLVLKFYQVELTPFLLELLVDTSKINAVVVCVEDVERAFEIFQNNFKIIQAAGGIVSNSKNQKLFIYRLDKWDLPKGKIEKNEAIEDAAIREVEEECGITSLVINGKLADTFHVYEQNEKIILKQTFWFRMSTNYDGKLIPQVEENITRAEWLSNNEINEIVLKNTYSAIRELLKVNDF